MVAIYKITNKVNGNSYIGQTVDIIRRFKEHRNRPFFKSSEDSILHRAIKKHGLHNFIFEVIEKSPKNLLNEKEVYWISYYDTYKNGYNATIGGDAVTSYKFDLEVINKVKYFLVNTKKTYTEIQEVTGLSLGSISDINTGKRYVEDIVYPLRKKTEKKKHCKRCSTKIYGRGKTQLCLSCYYIGLRGEK